MALTFDKKKGFLKDILGKIGSKAKSIGDSYNSLYKKKSDEFTMGLGKGKSASAGNMLDLQYLRKKALKSK